MAHQPILTYPKAAIRAANPGWPLGRWLVAGAWFFVAVSLARLIWIVASTTGDPEATYAVMGEGDAGMPLLTYAGGWGATLAWAQAIAVTLGTAFSIAPVRKFRRLGHGVLIVWAGLWLAGFGMTFLDTSEIQPLAQTGLMSFLFAGTVYRAWSPHRRRINSVEVDTTDRDGAGPDADIGASETPRPSSVTSFKRRLADAGRALRRKTAKHSPIVRRKLDDWSVAATRSCDRGIAKVKSAWPRVRDGHGDSRPSQKTASTHA